MREYVVDSGCRAHWRLRKRRRVDLVRLRDNLKGRVKQELELEKERRRSFACADRIDKCIWRSYENSRWAIGDDAEHYQCKCNANNSTLQNHSYTAKERTVALK